MTIQFTRNDTQLESFKIAHHIKVNKEWFMWVMGEKNLYSQFLQFVKNNSLATDRILFYEAFQVFEDELLIDLEGFRKHRFECDCFALQVFLRDSPCNHSFHLDMDVPSYLYHHVDRIYHFYFSSSTPIQLLLPQELLDQIKNDYKERDVTVFWLDVTIQFILNELYVTIFPHFVACIRDWIEDYNHTPDAVTPTERNSIYMLDAMERIQTFKEMKSRQLETIHPPKNETKAIKSYESMKSIIESIESYHIYTKSLYSKLSFNSESTLSSIKLDAQDCDAILSHYLVDESLGKQSLEISKSNQTHANTNSNPRKVNHTNSNARQVHQTEKDSQEQFERALSIVWAGYGTPRTTFKKIKNESKKRQLLSHVTTSLYFDYGVNALQSL